MLMTLIWIKGLIIRRIGRLLGAMTGVALTVALLSSLGNFIASSDAAMTQKAVQHLPVDWQILLTPGADIEKVIANIKQAIPYTALDSIGYADTAGFSSNTGGTTQTTGPGKALGIPSDYKQSFPAELRPLLGSMDGVLVAQQTASNLHVTVGDLVTIQRVGLSPVEVKIEGVIDLPEADSLFQAVGVPAGTVPQAPPDNVLLLPDQLWHSIFDPQANVHADSVRTELHIRIPHQLPTDPNAAFARAKQLANHVEASLAGSGIVGDNLAARLGGVREDALYTRVLFFFLGLPGAILAVLLTLAIAASSAQRRRKEQALLRTRGATASQIIALAGTESLIVGIVGVILGILLAFIASMLIATPLEWNSSTVLWTIIAAFAGLLLAFMAVVYPAWKETKQSTVAAVKVIIGHTRKPLWRRYYLDITFLALSAISFWRVASTSYKLVLAPEGVVQTSVNYEAFIAPLGLWIGGSLLLMRLWLVSLERGNMIFAFVLRPVVGGLSHIISSSLSRQKALVTRGIILVSLTFSFAVSTAVFNTTYNVQSLADAELTNGADVTITGSTASPPSNKLSELQAMPGISAIQPMQHRFAYVGNDLQDLYGIDPQHIGEVSTISNAFFGNGDAKATLSALANVPDGILISEETMNDYQLHPGDRVNLRLQNVADQQYHVIPFHLIGIVKEFPTAPKDSFLVANASYIAQQTGSNASEILLIHAKGDTTNLATVVRNTTKDLSGSKVTEIGSVQGTISSSLTAVNLRGLTKLEIGFAILLVAGSSGLIFWLELAERRRTYAILTALGAKKNQLSAFLWSEGLLILIGGGVSGVVLGFGIAEIFVKVLSGVFDPPPDFLHIPWSYLTVLIFSASIAMICAVLGARKMSQIQVIKALRDVNN
ncbi:MAG: transporter permease [Bacilli bacterium]|nr:transporter permease [Bacilli bacterium]